MFFFILNNPPFKVTKRQILLMEMQSWAEFTGKSFARLMSNYLYNSLFLNKPIENDVKSVPRMWNILFYSETKKNLTEFLNILQRHFYSRDKTLMRFIIFQKRIFSNGFTLKWNRNIWFERVAFSHRGKSHRTIKDWRKSYENIIIRPRRVPSNAIDLNCKQ